MTPSQGIFWDVFCGHARQVTFRVEANKGAVAARRMAVGTTIEADTKPKVFEMAAANIYFWTKKDEVCCLAMACPAAAKHPAIVIRSTKKAISPFFAA